MNLDKIAARRERNRLRKHAERVAQSGFRTSERMLFKARMRETCMDQVTLDHERGLEIGRIARKAYRDLPRRPRPRRQKRKGNPRPATAYRWFVRLLARGKPMSIVLREERRRTGETRQQADRRRQQEARSA